MRVMTILGTRPEIIRLSRVIPLLDKNSEHRMVWTGQNYDPRLSDIFFEQLNVRAADANLGVEETGFAAQAAAIIQRADEELAKFDPDRLLLLGDTNSALSAIPAARRGIPVYHMEAGNRCFDDRVPEEINRRLIDHASSVLMPYTHRSKENLVREGVPRERIFVTGNPIYQVLEYHNAQIEASTALMDYGVEKGAYFLVTLHRAENVDDQVRLESFLTGLSRIAKKHSCPVILSTHPRTRSKLDAFGLAPDDEHVKLMEPMGFQDFVHLEKNAKAVLTDSGTVQEEACIFNVPNVTLRDVTERAETVEVGSSVLSGADPDRIEAATDLALACTTGWKAPDEYRAEHVAETVAKIVLGYNHSHHNLAKR